MFEEKVNELLEKIEQDEKVTDYKLNIFLSDGSLIGIVEIYSERKLEKNT